MLFNNEADRTFFHHPLSIPSGPDFFAF